jgi:hypothetical protein
VRFAQKRAFGRKVSDEFTVPLCRLHHRELHRSRNEPLWWKTARIDPIQIARELWEATRPKPAPKTVIEAPGPGLPALPLTADHAPKSPCATKGQAPLDTAADSHRSDK